jgi:hypothetical protein
MRKKFCCDASRDMYEDYYMNQTGGAMPVFMGARIQRGHGLGSILSGLFRHILPFFKANGRQFATNLLKTGVDVAEDMFDNNKKLSESLKERVPQGIKRVFNDLSFQNGSGLAKRRKCIKTRKRDIFSKNGIRSRSIL